MTDWQPIATAPKDVEIVLWHGRANVGGWSDDWPYDKRAGATQGWVINGGYLIQATHWMPLPAPPSDHLK